MAGLELIEAFDGLTRPLGFIHRDASVEKNLRIPPSRFRRLLSSDHLVRRLKAIDELEG